MVSRMTGMMYSLLRSAGWPGFIVRHSTVTFWQRVRQNDDSEDPWLYTKCPDPKRYHRFTALFFLHCGAWSQRHKYRFTATLLQCTNFLTYLHHVPFLSRISKFWIYRVSSCWIAFQKISNLNGYFGALGRAASKNLSWIKTLLLVIHCFRGHQLFHLLPWSCKASKSESPSETTRKCLFSPANHHKLCLAWKFGRKKVPAEIATGVKLFSIFVTSESLMEMMSKPVHVMNTLFHRRQVSSHFHIDLESPKNLMQY